MQKIYLYTIMTPTVSIVTFVQSWPAPIFKPYDIQLDQNHFLMIEMYIPLASNMEQKSLIWVWLLGNASHFGSQTFVTGSYTYKQNPFTSQKFLQIYQGVCRFLCLVVWSEKIVWWICFHNLLLLASTDFLQVPLSLHTLANTAKNKPSGQEWEHLWAYVMSLLYFLMSVWKKQQPSNNLPKP